jgi:phosphatidylglycerophosphate synthase
MTWRAAGMEGTHAREKDGSLPFHTFDGGHLKNKFIAEITPANAVSLSRIPLVLTAFALAKDRPPLLAALLAGVHALDGVDGYIARKWGLGGSPHGADIDILSDHAVELIIAFEFAYRMKVIPKAIPWILATRDITTDFLRLYNEMIFAAGQGETHPHKAFGTFGKGGRAFSVIVKITESVVVPLMPSMGVWLSIAHVLANLYRGLPVVTSKTSRQIYRQIFENITKQQAQKDSCEDAALARKDT